MRRTRRGGTLRGAVSTRATRPRSRSARTKWTVRYTVNGVQRERSFADEMDAGKRVRPGTGLKKAQDFQLELTRGKRAQGKTYTDPKLAEESFMANAVQFVTKSARLQANERTRSSYPGLLNGDIKAAFGERTLVRQPHLGS
jgi:hypothetical protein